MECHKTAFLFPFAPSPFYCRRVVSKRCRELLRRGCCVARKSQSAAVVYQKSERERESEKGVFPIVEIFNLWPPSYNFQFSRELSFLFIVLHFKVQTLWVIKQKRVGEALTDNNKGKLCSDANARLRAHKRASFLQWIQIFNCFLISAKRQLPYGELIRNRHKSNKVVGAHIAASKLRISTQRAEPKTSEIYICYAEVLWSRE